MSTANLSRMLRWNTVRRGEREAVVDGEARLTYAELDARVDAMAFALRELGVGRGDIVAILGRNSIRYLVEIFAVARIGAVYLPLNWRLHANEISYILDHAGVLAILADGEFVDNVRRSDLPRLAHCLQHTDGEPAPGWLSADSLLTGWSGEPIPDADVGPDDLQRILYTSGTTAHPKGVMTTHGNVIWTQLGQILELGLSAADRTMMSAPLFHVSGLDAPGLTTLYIGGTVVLTHSFTGADVVRLIETERITGVVLAAQIVYDILRMPDLARRDLSSWRFAIFGGVPPAGCERFHAALPHVHRVDTFGMTELTNGASYLDAAHRDTKIGSQGTPFPHTDIRVVGPDGESLPPGEVGEIVVRGPKVAVGYWRDPEATAHAWRDGWFHSGDMAYLDEEGFLWFVDRQKDMIKSGGENIASAEIERVLAGHPAVDQVAVIGVPDSQWDQVPKAFVILRPDAHAATSDATSHSMGNSVGDSAKDIVDDLRAHCERHLARFKLPKHYAIVTELPRNDSGKVLKRVLREREGGPT